MHFNKKVYSILIGFFSLLSQMVCGQDQMIADSLTRIYRADTLRDTAKLELLLDLSFNEVNDLNRALSYSEELIHLSALAKNTKYLHSGYFQKGNKKRLLGDLQEALDAYFKCVEIATRSHMKVAEGDDYGAIADIYSLSNDRDNAGNYYRKAIDILRQSNDSIALASAISNAGDDYLNQKKYDSALVYFQESLMIFEKVNYLTGRAYSLGNIGMVYANIGKNDLAEKKINEAIPILEKTGDFYPICVYLISMSDIFQEKKDLKSASKYAQRSLQLAQQYGLKQQVGDAALKLADLYEKTGDSKKSLVYYKMGIAYRDSVLNIQSVQKMSNLRSNYEIAQKQIQVNLLNQQRKNQQIILRSLLIILALAMIILGTLYWYYRNISRERKRSESLLLNILPAETARELKQNGRVNAVKFDQVTVLFTDFIQFTRLAEAVDPEQLVNSIDYYFKGFDEISIKYGLEKIKTVGDSYMCACGLPTASPTHARNIILAAREMIGLVKTEMNTADGLIHFEVRIGVHTGPVVAGIVGIRKWQYDIWGDTVNIASRMESMSDSGRINLSESTYNEIKNEFECEYRGEIEVKNRGLLKMYFLKD
jgi:class 3 adenylate cyclase